MRWIVSIVTAVCLLVAAGARNDPRQTSAPDTQQLCATHGASAWIPARRGSAPTHARLGAFVVADEAQPSRSDRALALAAIVPCLPVLEQHTGSVSIRGPPLG